MRTVQTELNALIDREGGYVNDPDDLGGETNFGITVETARRNGYRGPMRDLTRPQAYAIYELEYWRNPRFDKVHLRSAKLAFEIFDAGVNCGVARASRWLQIGLNALNAGGRHYPDIDEDGRIGPGTLSALDEFLRIRKAKGELVLFRALNALQGAHYLDLSRKLPSQEKYTFGWFLNRVE